MTTPETRSRLRALEQQRTTPTPAPLDGQAQIPLTWQQGALWDWARPIPPTPAPQRPTRPRKPAPKRRRRHRFVEIINPAGTRHPYRWHGRHITTITVPEEYL